MNQADNSALYVIDASEQDRRVVASCAEDLGLVCHQFSTIQAFFGYSDLQRPGCLVFDYAGQGIEGLELCQLMVQEFDTPLPAIVTSHISDIETALQFFRAGVMNYLVKPLRRAEIRDSVYRCITKDKNRLYWAARFQLLDEKMQRLTDRERSVMEHVVTGETNQVIAEAFNLSPRTIESTRARIYRKFQICSAAELASDHREHQLLRLLLRDES